MCAPVMMKRRFVDKKKASLERLALLIKQGIRLDGYDILGLRTFLALSKRKLNLLAFGKRFETGASNRAKMSEYIGAGLLFDKTKTFCFVEPFYGSFDCVRHNNS